MKHYGDITKINGAAVEPVDVICGGSPCQDLSVAGKRAGLAGERSGLFMEQIRIVKEMRKHVTELHSNGANELVRPCRYLVWENVPGAYSSNSGEDFRAVLEEICKVVDENAVIPGPPNGKWSYAGCIMGSVDGRPYSVAWRTHDAQYWGKTVRDSNTGDVLEMGTPQRRRRIALVADFGGTTAAEILFECESMPGDTEPCGTPRQAAPGDVEGGVGTTVSFQERAGKPGGGKGILIQDEHTGALNQQCGQSVCYPISTMNATRENEERRTSFGVGENNDPQFTISTAHEHAVYYDPQGCLNPWDVQSKHVQPENGVAETLYSGECRGGGGESYVMQDNTVALETSFFGASEGVAGTCKARDYKDPQIVCGAEPILLESNQNHATVQTDGVSTSLPASMGMGGGYTPMVCQQQTDENGAGFSLRSKDTQIAYGFEPGAAQRLDTENRFYEDHTPTLRAKMGDNQTAVAYGISPFASNAMLSSNPTSGIYEADTARTLDLNGGSPACNQGGMAIVETYRKTAHPQNAEQGQGYEETTVNDTLNCHDNGESRTPTLVCQQEVFENHSQDTRYRHMGDVSQPISATFGCGGNNQPFVVKEVYDASRRHSYQPLGEVCETVQAAYGTGGNNVPMVAETTGALMASGYSKLGTQEAMNGMYIVENSNWDGSQVSPTLTSNNANGGQRMPDKDNFNAVISLTTEVTPKTDENDMGFSLRGRDYKDPQAICTAVDCRCNTENENVNGTLQSKKDGGYNINSNNVARIGSVVRRLTPKECERLQGFFDDWTNLGEWTDSKGKLHKDADSCRYKALGNSIALPFWKWMAIRMAKHLPKDATMASLFDGIGGFPLSYYLAGVTPVWASEIEEFPIAVTKRHFGENGDLERFINAEPAAAFPGTTSGTYGIDRASFNQGANAKFGFSVEKELAPTVIAKGPGGVVTG